MTIKINYGCIMGYIGILIAAVNGANGVDKLSLCPGGPETELWVIGGQSNTHCGMITADIISIADPDIWMLNMDGAWMPAVEPLHRFYATENSKIKQPFLEIFGNFGLKEETYQKNREILRQDPHKAQLLGTGFALPFARHLRQYMTKPIGLIPCGLGGSSMAYWNPARQDEPNSLYGFMREQIDRAGGKISGVLWYQGESDTGTDTTVECYIQNMLNLIDGLRTDLGQPELPFLTVQIGKYVISDPSQSPTRWEKIRDLQRRLPGLRPNVFITTALDTPLDDPIHISTQGHQILGVRLAEIALSEVYGQKDHAHMILPESIEKLDPNGIGIPPCFGRPDVWRITFRGVTGHLTAMPTPTGFEVRPPSGSTKPLQLYRVEIDPKNPSALLIYIGAAQGIDPGTMLIHAPGVNPFTNLADDKNMPIPAFGPMVLPLSGKETISP